MSSPSQTDPKSASLPYPAWCGWFPTIELDNLFRPSPFRWSAGPPCPFPLLAIGMRCPEVMDKRWGWVWCASRKLPVCPTLQRCPLPSSERGQVKGKLLCCHAPHSLAPTASSVSLWRGVSEQWLSLRGIILFLFLKYFCLLSLERKEGEGETLIVVPLIYAFICWFLYVPWLGDWTWAYWDDALTNWATQPGWDNFIFIHNNNSL